MNKQLQADLTNLEAVLDSAKKQGLDFLSTLNERPTSVHHKNDIADNLVQQGLGAQEALKQFSERFESIMVSSTGPRYWGYVTGGSTPASIVGDWLAAVYDQNTQAVSGQGDVSAVVEQETINLLLDLFGLPKDYLGGFVTGATMSNFTCLAVARQWLGKALGKDFAKEGVSGRINILSATPHSSALKTLSMLGIGSNNVIKVTVLEGNREAVNTDDLEKKLMALNGEPSILISSAGTVNTVDFDNFEAIALLKQKYNFWWHIDAAFGGFAACSPKYKHLVEGWEFADSITTDCHKWLNVPYESAFYLIKEAHKYLQVETFQNSNAPYLGDPLENFSYLNFLPENSRRLKALPAWFSLMAYGKEGYRQIVENGVDMAQHFESFVNQNDGFEVLAPVRLNTVCFTLKGNDEKVPAFLKTLNNTGQVFMTPTVYNGKKGIRAAFVNWRTTLKDVELVIDQMRKVLSELA